MIDFTSEVQILSNLFQPHSQLSWINVGAIRDLHFTTGGFATHSTGLMKFYQTPVFFLFLNFLINVFTS